MSSRVLDFEKYTAKARQAVAEGQVLLLNQNHVLAPSAEGKPCCCIWQNAASLL